MIHEHFNLVGYDVGEVIGEGGQAQVRIARNTLTDQVCAIKILSKASVELQNLQKEIRIHKSVTHENIIHLFTTSEDESHMFLVLELAAGGELFDRIEPDVGIQEELAHMYFQQLLAGMTYLHERGISHRDLKPENMLLDTHGNLKVSDFGLATVFRFKGQSRVLTTPCGTPPYVAPEIHRMQYQGDLVDIWSAGIILYVLLAGNTPWSEPTQHDEEFRYFVKRYPNNLNYHPWTLFSPQVRELLCGILNVDQESRYRIDDIKKNPWFQLPNSMLTNGKVNDPGMVASRLKTNDPEEFDATQPIAYSQPMDIRMHGDSPDFDASQLPTFGGIISFSQPQGYNMAESPTLAKDRYMATLSQAQKPVPELFHSERLTRFYSSCDPSDIFSALSQTLEGFLVPFKLHHKLMKISFSTVDRRKCQLQGEITIQPVNALYMVSFRKSKGDPIEFKRFYKALHESVVDIVHV